MENFLREVFENFERNYIQAPLDVTDVVNALSVQKDKFRESYLRIVSITAWREDLINEKVDKTCSSFFREANNDIFSSHILARYGSWRVSLMSMRSFIENILFGLYYIDHPVELRLWESGEHKLGFSENLKYFEGHPDFKGKSIAKNALEDLKKEYAQLSRAVHGSSNSFRMSQDGKVHGVNSMDISKLSSWLTRERATINAINIILIAFFHKQLAGTSLPGLRKAVSLSIKSRQFSVIKDEFSVRLTTHSDLVNQLKAIYIQTENNQN